MRKLATLAKFGATVAAYVTEGFKVLSGGPKTLTLEPDSERPQRRACTVPLATSPNERSFRSHEPRCRIIRLRVPHREGRETFHFDCQISVDLDRMRVDRRGSTAWLFGRGHEGSGGMGFMAASSPLLLVPMIVPLLMLVSARYAHQERERGMSRHCIAIMEALKGKLDPDTLRLLETAFKNTWTHDAAMKRKVTFEQASELLQGCQLDEHLHSAERSMDRRGRRWNRWYDADQNVVASADIVDGGPCVVQVLGSRFIQDQADFLIGTCKRRNRFVDGREAVDEA